MKKKILSLVLVAAMVVSMTGCSLPFTKSSKTSKKAAATKTYDYDVDKIVKLGDYKGVEVTTSVSDDDVQTEIDSVIEENTKDEQITKGKAKKGDKVNIKYEGTIDGEVFDGGTSDSYDLELGSGTFIDGFEDQLVGVKVGKEITVKVTFPEDYSSEDLAGKAAEFKTTINYIHGESVKPELDDDFVQTVSETSKTVDEYKAEIKKQLEDEKQKNKGYSAFQVAYDNATVDKYPDELIEVMTNRFDASYHTMATNYGYEFKDFLSASQMTEEDYKKELQTQSEYYAKQYLVAQAIADKEEISYTDEEFKSEIEGYIKDYGQEDEKALKKYFKDNYNTELDEIVGETLLVEKVAEWLGKNATEK